MMHCFVLHSVYRHCTNFSDDFDEKSNQKKRCTTNLKVQSPGAMGHQFWLEHSDLKPRYTQKCCQIKNH